MNWKILTAFGGITAIALSSPVLAENFNDLNQLLSTKQCEACDLSGTGLALANLPGANLKGANLSNANLSQANLSRADLRGADLTGASLYGANLTGADLRGAKLEGTDLRDSYLYNADLTGTNLNTAFVQGATGMPEYAGSADMFFRWATGEAKRGNYKGALDNYNKAISIDADFAPAYLGRGLVQYRLGHRTEANQDAVIASELYQSQKNTGGYEASQQFIEAMVIADKRAVEGPSTESEGDFLGLVQGIMSIGLRFLLP